MACKKLAEIGNDLGHFMDAAGHIAQALLFSDDKTEEWQDNCYAVFQDIRQQVEEILREKDIRLALKWFTKLVDSVPTDLTWLKSEVGSGCQSEIEHSIVQHRPSCQCFI